jgi:hypothetical protein
MKHSLRRLAAARTAIPLGVAAAVAAGFLAGSAAPPSKAATAPGRATDLAVVQQHVLAAGANTIVVNCLNKEQARPASFILTCADGGDYLTGLHWVNWGSEAFATGIEKVNNCTPNCAQGKFVSYPALVALWRPEPLPDHPGVRYFTKITRIYPGKRPPLYNCHGIGTPPCHPVTSTFDLWSHT